MKILYTFLIPYFVLFNCNTWAKEPILNIEMRCGWFDNPSPGNISLIDHDEEWVIGIQGGYQVKNDWKWPAFKKSQWVSTGNGSYGYGCACLKVTSNKSTQEIIHIYSASPRPLSQCRKDHALKEPD